MPPAFRAVAVRRMVLRYTSSMYRRDAWPTLASLFCISSISAWSLASEERKKLSEPPSAYCSSSIFSVSLLILGAYRPNNASFSRRNRQTSRSLAACQASQCSGTPFCQPSLASCALCLARLRRRLSVSSSSSFSHGSAISRAVILQAPRLAPAAPPRPVPAGSGLPLLPSTHHLC